MGRQLLILALGFAIGTVFALLPLGAKNLGTAFGVGQLDLRRHPGRDPLRTLTDVCNPQGYKRWAHAG